MASEQLWRETKRERLSLYEDAIVSVLLNNLKIDEDGKYLKRNMRKKAGHSEARAVALPQEGWYTAADIATFAGVHQANILTYAKTLEKRDIVERVPIKYQDSRRRPASLHFYRVKHTKTAFTKLWKFFIDVKQEAFYALSDYHERMLAQKSCQELMVGFAKEMNPLFNMDEEFIEEVNLYALTFPQELKLYLDGKLDYATTIRNMQELIPDKNECIHFNMAMNAFRLYLTRSGVVNKDFEKLRQIERTARGSKEEEEAEVHTAFSMLSNNPSAYLLAFKNAYMSYTTLLQGEKHTRGDKHRGHPKTPVTHT